MISNHGEEDGVGPDMDGEMFKSAHFFKIPINTRNLELSLWSSAGTSTVSGGFVVDAIMMNVITVGRTKVP